MGFFYGEIEASSGGVVSVSDFRSGLMFESYWRRNSAHDCTGLHCTELFIITLPSSQYDLDTVEKDLKH